ncbi:MAG TPA: hypothetical protein VMX75_11315 [Spirochaetia bacterium]|nr:hypothetical protein [Spirochaetia bacterium]
MNHSLFRSFILGGLILVLSAAAVAADEAAQAWAKVYERAETIYQRHQVMLSMVEEDNPELIPVFMDALSDLVQERKSKALGQRDEAVRDEIKRLIVRELGDLKALETAPLIFTVVKESSDGNLKREALIALGKTGDKAFAREITRILDSLNTFHGESPAVDDDKIAFGCIDAIKNLKDPAGYKTIFKALFAGYSSQVIKAAEEALAAIVDDPTEILRDIIRTEKDPKIKLLALSRSRDSSASPENRVTIALVSLQQGLDANPNNIQESIAYSKLRENAMLILLDLKARKRDAVPYVERVLYLDTDPVEQIYAIRVLKVIAYDEAVQALAQFLGYYNDRRGDGLAVPPDRERIVIEAVRALGDLKSKSAREELLRAKFVGYSYDVVREVDKALLAMK